jgi:hypothetical protein
MTVVDQGSALLQGMQVVPDYGAVQARNQQLRAQQQALALREQEMRQAIVEREQAQQRQAAWQQRVAEIQRNPDPRFIQQTLLEFPEQREVLSSAFGDPNDEMAQGNLREMAAIYGRLQGGDAKGAADLLDRRIAADAANGNPPDEDDVAMAAALRSGDADDINAAKAMMGMVIAAQPGADKFFGNLEKANGSRGERTQAWKLAEDAYEAALRDGATPEEAARERSRVFDAVKTNTIDPFVTPQPGAIVGRQSSYPGGGAPRTAQGGGDPASSGGQGATTPEQETAAGRVMQRALASKRMTRAEYDGLVRDFGPRGAEAARNFVRVNGIAVEGGQEGPRKVRSKGEYDSLPSGTEYIAPDGSRRRKP